MPVHVVGRAISDFHPLRPAEAKLLRAVRKGTECILAASRPRPDDENKRTKTVRASFIRFLALGGSGASPVHEKGIQLQGAYIEGDLDFRSCKGVSPLSLRRSLIAGKVSFYDAHMRTIIFDGCQIRGGRNKDRRRTRIVTFDASRAKIDGSVFFREDVSGARSERFEVFGEVRFVGAEIEGRLQCEGASFRNAGGWALFFSRAKIAGGVYLRKDESKSSTPFEAFGQVRFRCAEIGGNLECQGAIFNNKRGKSLFCDGAKIAGNVQLSKGFSARGEVDFLGAEVGGDVRCEGGRFKNPLYTALSLSNAKVNGSVHLSDKFAAAGEVEMVDAQIGGRLNFEKGLFYNPKSKIERISTDPGDGSTRALYFSGSKIVGSVLLNNVHAVGQVRFLNALIGGDLQCDNGTIKNPGHRALFFDRTTIAGSVTMHGLRATGRVRFASAEIRGDLRCKGAKLYNEAQNQTGLRQEQGNRALFFSRTRIEGSVYLSHGFNAKGGVRFRSAAIGGTLLFDGAFLENAGAEALYFNNSRISGTVSFNNNRLTREPFRAQGEVQFIGAQIGGDINCNGAIFENPKRLALVFSRAKIGGRVYLNKGFRSEGAVRFRGAEIGSDLDCSRASFCILAEATRDNSLQPGAIRHGPEKWFTTALAFSAARIGGDVLLSHSEFAGEVRFHGTNIGGSVHCADVEIKGNGCSGSDDDRALDCAGSQISRNFSIKNLVAKGEVRFDHANIDGNVECYSSTFAAINPNGSCRLNTALSFHGASVKNALTFCSPRQMKNTAVIGNLDLRDAQVGSFVDCKHSWPSNGNYIMFDGFTYERFAEGAPWEAFERKDWLRRQPPEDLGKNFKPQPFEQLVGVLKSAGHNKEAREIAILKQQLLTRRARLQFQPFSWLWRSFLQLSIGYGYNPQRIFIATFCLWLLCGYVYQSAESQHIFAPTVAGYFFNGKMEECRPSDTAPERWNGTDCYSKLGQEYVAFNPFIFSLDVILPIVNLHQEEAWQPMPRPLKMEIGNRAFILPCVRCVMWLETLFGWLAAIMLTAFVSGVIKK